MIIPIEIDNHEILVRFIFLDDFKKKPPAMESLKSGEVFMDDRNSGVSLQRGRYTNVQFCKNSAEKIKNKEFIGFLIFKMEKTGMLTTPKRSILTSYFHLPKITI